MICAGRVTGTLGHLAIVALPAARVGDGVRMHRAHHPPLGGCVASVERTHSIVAPLGALIGVAAGDRVESAPDALACILGFGALGRAVGPLGEPLDDGGSLQGNRARVPLAGQRLARLPVATPWWTGIRAIDGLLTIGRGARVGVFGAPGAGKTTLLETIARAATGDAVVVGLIGERGREAARWLGRANRRTTIVCATADRSAAERVRAAELAMSQGMNLRARGLDVVLILDSLARYATALRELRGGLGETIGRGGYPVGVFAELARYLESAGNAERGSLTMLATVLSDGADEREPVADAARAALDGHIALSSALARSGRFPAIDVLASTSRTMDDVVTAQHRAAAATVRAALARLNETADLRSLGFADASDEALARASAAEPELRAFLEQRGPASPDETMERLAALAANLDPQ
jgi:type III secretion protein N (ATPase)